MGPAMQALDERARKWVRYRIWDGMNPTAAARAAGYAPGVQPHQLRVQGFRLNTNPRVIEAMREEGERLLGHAAPLAIAGLVRQLDSKSPKIRAAAIESVLDRTGYSRRTAQDIRVEHTDGRSTDALLAALEAYAAERRVPKQIEAKAEEVNGEDSHTIAVVIPTAGDGRGG